MKALGPVDRRRLAEDHLVADVVSHVRVLVAPKFPRSRFRYQLMLPLRDASLRPRIEEIAGVRVRYVQTCSHAATSRGRAGEARARAGAAQDVGFESAVQAAESITGRGKSCSAAGGQQAERVLSDGIHE